MSKDHISGENADYFCPILGQDISSTTCAEICLWADEYLTVETEEIYLEFFNEIQDYCHDYLKVDTKEDIAAICRDCIHHWRQQ